MLPYSRYHILEHYIILELITLINTYYVYTRHYARIQYNVVLTDIIRIVSCLKFLLSHLYLILL